MPVVAQHDRKPLEIVPGQHVRIVSGPTILENAAMDDLTPERIEVEYACTRSSCGQSSTWRKSFPESAFEKVEDLVGVKGIGVTALERLRPYVVLRGKTTATTAD